MEFPVIDELDSELPGLCPGGVRKPRQGHEHAGASRQFLPQQRSAEFADLIHSDEPGLPSLALNDRAPLAFRESQVDIAIGCRLTAGFFDSPALAPEDLADEPLE